MINIDDEKDNIVNKKEKSIPLITSIYYDNKNKENEIEKKNKKTNI